MQKYTEYSRHLEPLKRSFMLNGKRIIPKVGIFMIHNKDESYRRIVSSKRIEITFRDYMRMLAMQSHKCHSLQVAYNEAYGNLYYKELAVCHPKELSDLKTYWCEIYNQENKRSSYGENHWTKKRKLNHSVEKDL